MTAKPIPQGTNCLSKHTIEELTQFEHLITGETLLIVFQNRSVATNSVHAMLNIVTIWLLQRTQRNV